MHSFLSLFLRFPPLWFKPREVRLVSSNLYQAEFLLHSNTKNLSYLWYLIFNFLHCPDFNMKKSISWYLNALIQKDSLSHIKLLCLKAEELPKLIFFNFKLFWGRSVNNRIFLLLYTCVKEIKAVEPFALQYIILSFYKMEIY